jgi:hypothetical protein
MQDLHELLQEIELTMIERSQVDMQRTQLIANAAAEIGIAPDKVTARRLTRELGGEVGQALDEAADSLREVIAQLGPIAAANRSLMEQELEVIDGVVKLATAVNGPATYDRPGTDATGEARQLLDLQV